MTVHYRYKYSGRLGSYSLEFTADDLPTCDDMLMTTLEKKAYQFMVYDGSNHVTLTIFERTILED